MNKVLSKNEPSHGPVYTFVKTDDLANVKWGVRFYVPRKSQKQS